MLIGVSTGLGVARFDSAVQPMIEWAVDQPLWRSRYMNGGR
jgi:hypothetical protein